MKAIFRGVVNTGDFTDDKTMNSKEQQWKDLKVKSFS